MSFGVIRSQILFPLELKHSIINRLGVCEEYVLGEGSAALILRRFALVEMYLQGLGGQV